MKIKSKDNRLKEKVILENKLQVRFYLDGKEIYMHKEFILLAKELSLKINGAILCNQLKLMKFKMWIQDQALPYLNNNKILLTTKIQIM